MRQQIDEIVAQIPELRELERLREVPYEFVTRDQFQDDLQGLIEEETDPQQLATEERVLKRLDLLPEDLDLREAILELYGSQVAAFYLPETASFYIIGEPESLEPFDRLVVAHEYTHALQDQHFNLEDDRITDPSEGDAALAQTAAIEGDATWLMFLWAQQNLTQQEMLALFNQSLNPSDQELLASMPPILRRQLEFPYNDGFIFSLEVYSSAGGWSAIDETITDPPESSEQILHPEKYFEDEQPIEVEVPDLSQALGEGWARTYEQTFGEVNLQVLVAGGEEPETPTPGSLPEQPFAEAAAGWGGDRLAMYESEDGGWAIAWELAWDTQSDAEEFAARARELRDTLGGESRIRVASERVVILLADDAETLPVVEEALGFSGPGAVTRP